VWVGLLRIMQLPRVAITSGDPAGIGPEIAARAAADKRVRAVCEPVIYRPPAGQTFEPGVLNADAGRAAYDLIVRAVEDARRGAVQAIATAPVNKEAFRLAGLPWAGHTDLLAHLTGAREVAMMKIRERGLGMKLSRVEQAFDGSKLIFYFTADGRVDFRELVRELAAEFSTRIEMRQIGVRDEAKMMGGYGSCGRPLCCTTFLTTFEPVSIKMAKQQDLSLNPSKLSGLCGRLKCCLRYELPNAKGQVHGGCGSEGGCDNPTGCGSGGCGSGGCGSCSCHS